MAFAVRRMTAILLVVGLAAGCSNRVRLRPLPVIFGPERVDLCSITPPSRQTSDLRVFYATNRSASGPADDRRYGNGMDEHLRLGVATVRMGDDDETWEEICRASAGDGGNPVFRLERASEIGQARSDDEDDGYDVAFAEAINEQLAGSANRQVNVYVHGFRTTFTWEVEMMSKLSHCSARAGAMVCFAWPARQSLLLYGSDGRRGRASAHHLADLIELLARKTQAQRINVLSYSAGAAVVAEALVQLRNRYPDDDAAQLSERLRIGNVIFAASDIDLQTFAKRQLASVDELSQNVVIYIASDDGALGFASFFAGASRLGRPNVAELGLTRADLEEAAKNTRLQVIDVSGAPGPRGHAYWYTNDWVMTDLLVNFLWQIPAAERGLYHKSLEARWSFPNDYPQRVTEAVLRLVPPTTAPTAPTLSARAS